MLYAFHVGVFALGGDGATPDANPDHNVADENEREGQQVAENDISYDEVDVLFVLWRPLLDTEQDLWAAGWQAGQIEIHRPRNGRR